MFEELSPPYKTIVADPPWHYEQGGPTTGWGPLRPPPYSSMGVEEICNLPVRSLYDGDAHLWLWTTNGYLDDSYDVIRAWGFKPSQILTWCKPPRGIGPGGAFSNTTEFLHYCWRGKSAPAARYDTTWFQWTRGPHSVKPPAAMDLIESISPSPYLELFARAPRMGWDSWGYGFE
jgi:N6-adenosine-specific RNA methylase IME4